MYVRNVHVYIYIVYLDQFHTHIPIRKRQESEISHILNLWCVPL